MTDTGPAGTGADKLTAAYRAVAERVGWTQEILSIAAAGEFMVVLHRNRTGDGRSHIGAGICRIDEDGKILDIFPMAPRSWTWIPDSPH